MVVRRSFCSLRNFLAFFPTVYLLDNTHLYIQSHMYNTVQLCKYTYRYACYMHAYPPSSFKGYPGWHVGPVPKWYLLGVANNHGGSLWFCIYGCCLHLFAGLGWFRAIENPILLTKCGNSSQTKAWTRLSSNPPESTLQSSIHLRIVSSSPIISGKTIEQWLKSRTRSNQ